MYTELRTFGLSTENNNLQKVFHIWLKDVLIPSLQYFESIATASLNQNKTTKRLEDKRQERVSIIIRMIILSGWIAHTVACVA